MTGIDLIAQERKEQIEKHGRTPENDKKYNKKGEMIEAAKAILNADYYMDIEKSLLAPDGWDENIFEKMMNKSYEQRLIIAGAFIAAELDRIKN